MSQIGYAIILLCLVWFAGSLYSGFQIWKSYVTLVKAELCLVLSFVLQDYKILVCTQLLVMIVIAARQSRLYFVFKPVSWLAGDSRLRQTFSLRIHLVERRSLSPYLSFHYYPSSYQSLEASLSTSISRSIAGAIVFLLDRNKPVRFLRLSR